MVAVLEVVQFNTSTNNGIDAGLVNPQLRGAHTIGLFLTLEIAHPEKLSGLCPVKF